MLLDTSGLFSFLHRPEPHHENAVHHMGSVRQLLTHNYVLAELFRFALHGDFRAPLS